MAIHSAQSKVSRIGPHITKKKKKKKMTKVQDIKLDYDKNNMKTNKLEMISCQAEDSDASQKAVTSLRETKNSYQIIKFSSEGS